MRRSQEIVRVLFVEDSQADVDLARWVLERDGLHFEWTRVATEPALRCALSEFRPHVVLCDYALPGFSGSDALKIVRKVCPLTPCLFVSGAIGDEVAISSLDEGLTDYLLKSNLRRLGPAVRRALAEARERVHSQKIEAELHRLSNYDTITGLPNLGLLNACAVRSMLRASNNQQMMAVVTVNLNAFRLVEEGFGRAIGDDMLRSVGDAMSAAVTEPAAVARSGADEFVIILSGLSDVLDVTAPVRRILDAVAAPRAVGGQDLRITATAGIAVYPEHGNDFDVLLRKSSAAMREAKVHSPGGMRFYSGDVAERAQHRLRLETRLRRALQNRELTLHYQPQFDMGSGIACGVEALLRWMPPGEEAIPPSVFVPVAEQTGMIASLGAWALEEACRAVVHWHHPGQPPPTLCVNVSTQQISNEFTGHLKRVIDSTDFPADCLELEITESLLIQGAQQALQCIEAWKRLGVRVAVDDFGTGYSGLSYLSQLPIDRLKLDKSLIQSITTELKDATIVRTMISLGRELGLTVLAEGVETEAQFAMLSRLGCQQVQGYLTARPAPALEARALLQKTWGNRSRPLLGARRRRVEANHAF
ncbi:MAG TPA: GGDEF domain-containing response regulator [Steroidobacteraceae bacterium]